MPVRPLSLELAEIARNQLNEDPDRLENGLQHLKDWIAKQPHLKARTDDQWLAAFLRGSKFSLEKAKEKLELFYSLRSAAPEIFVVDPKSPRTKEIIGLGSSLILPKSKNLTDPRIILVRPGVTNPNKYHIADILAVDNLKQRILQIEDDAMIVCGLSVIMDLAGVTMAHFTQMTPTLMKKMVLSGQDASPFRMKGVHYLNTPAGFETVFNFAKTLLNEKNKSRLHVHNKNYEALYKFIPKEILPAEYGGNAGTIQEIVDSWQKKLEEYSDWLVEDMQYKTDESKRSGKPKTPEDLFGVDGSFRQLSFD